MIRITHLSHRIGRAEILHDVTLDIARPGVTALVGPNGAGKSTLLSLVARLIPLQTGSIEVAGLPVGSTPGDVLARRLAVLPQSFDIAPRLTVGQLVAFGRYPHSKGRPTAACRDAVDASIARFELEPLRDRMLDTLSGGQRQRALLAMIHAQDTAYLLLDEPLNNLDIAASRHLMQHLRRMAEEDGKSVLIVIHDINYACAYADTLAVLADGRLAAVGPPAEVVTDALMTEVFRTDARIIHHQGRIQVQV